MKLLEGNARGFLYQFHTDVEKISQIDAKMDDLKQDLVLWEKIRTEVLNKKQ